MDRVITTMVIRLLDDHTYCARSAFSSFAWGFGSAVPFFGHYFTANQCVLTCVLWTFSVISNRLAAVLKGGHFDLLFGRLEGGGGRG